MCPVGRQTVDAHGFLAGASAECKGAARLERSLEHNARFEPAHLKPDRAIPHPVPLYTFKSPNGVRFQPPIFCSNLDSSHAVQDSSQAQHGSSLPFILTFHVALCLCSPCISPGPSDQGIKQDPHPNPKPYKLVRSTTGQSCTKFSLYGIASILFPGFIDPSSVALCRNTDLQKWCLGEALEALYQALGACCSSLFAAG